ncbi:MAG: flagellar basal-body rod protein FlgG [Alphaproteobacteria bacterium]|nr:flagellar basal-body rod protein FlgG [Alphaproteobacteria bacterium]
MRALYIASTGMAAQERNVEVISNNIANMRTTGYKKQRAEFQDLLYQQLRRAGSQSSDAGTIVPVGVEIGSGVRTAATSRVTSQGSVVPTEKELDLAIRGEGYFVITLPDGRTAYTRDGSFERSATGEIVTVDGYTVQPGIVIPEDARDIAINASGVVEAYIGTESTPTELGQVQLATFVNTAGLASIGENLFSETPASGAPQTGMPGTNGVGDLLQSYLEMSNVNAVTEIADMISAQRAYEMNARVISGADEMLRATANLT